MKNKAPLYVAIAIVGSVAFNFNSFTGNKTNATTTSAAASTPAKPKYGRNEAVAACQLKLENTLRDPGSVRYDRNLTAYVYEDNLHKVALVYNAKNGFGGYAGQDIYTCTFK